MATKTLVIWFAHKVEQYNNVVRGSGFFVTPEEINDELDRVASDHMPSGSGFDNGTMLALERSTGDKLVFSTMYHHMDPHGSYTDWTNHFVTVTPSFIGGFDLKVSGRNKNEIKDYIADVFRNALSVDFEVPGA